MLSAFQLGIAHVQLERTHNSMNPKQFETYLDPRQVALLQKDPSRLKLGGEEKK